VFVFFTMQYLSGLFMLSYMNKSTSSIFGYRLRAMTMSSIKMLYNIAQGFLLLVILCGLHDLSTGSLIFGTDYTMAPKGTDITINVSTIHNFMLNSICYWLSISAIYLMLPFIIVSYKYRNKVSFRAMFTQKLQII